RQSEAATPDRGRRSRGRAVLYHRHRHVDGDEALKARPTNLPVPRPEAPGEAPERAGRYFFLVTMSKFAWSGPPAGASNSLVLASFHSGGIGSAGGFGLLLRSPPSGVPSTGLKSAPVVSRKVAMRTRCFPTTAPLVLSSTTRVNRPFASVWPYEPR